MRKMPKGEIKPKEDGEEIVGQSAVSSTQEEDEDKPYDTQDQDQSQGQESPPQERVSPSRSTNQEQVTPSQATPQASISRPRTRQQARIEIQAQGNDNREGQSSPIRGSQLFEQSNNEQANNDSEDDGEPLPIQDTHITREQVIAQAQDVGTPHLAPQQPQVKRVNRTLAHPSDLIIGNPSQGVKTRSQYHTSFCKHVAFVSCVEPKNVDDALQEGDWVMAIQEELNNFTRNEVWELVERSKGKNVIGTKWVFKNKEDEHGVVVRNKVRLIAKGFSQVEGLDFGETFALVARLEAIHILLAYASSHNIKLYRMDVKSAFLNGYINELVYVEQPPGFEDPNYPNHVYRLFKTLYGLKQAPRAWYERLSDFLEEKGFKIGRVDTTLFTKTIGNDLFICQIYVDDIIFGSTNNVLCDEFSKMMSEEFEMSMIGELTMFLGFQIKQLKDGIFIHQEKYIHDLLKRFGMEDCKEIKTPMASNGQIEPDLQGKPIDQKLYRSMIGSLLYLTASRPDIMFSVCMCARYQANPKESHEKAVKRILRYLRYTPSFGLWYPKGAHFKLLGYSNSDFAGCKID